MFATIKKFWVRNHHCTLNLGENFDEEHDTCIVFKYFPKKYLLLHQTKRRKGREWGVMGRVERRERNAKEKRNPAMPSPSDRLENIS